MLNGVIPGRLYDHFMLFSVALSILVSPVLAKKYNLYAEELLIFFVKQGELLYGSEFLVYNVHSLVHLASDAKCYGSLDECSAFRFESYLHQLKRLVRSGRNPLSQIVKRLGEMDRQVKEPPKLTTTLRTQRPENIFALSDVECCEVVSLQLAEGQHESVLCGVYDHLEPLFMEPCDSRLVGVYKGHINHTKMKKLSLELLVRKAFVVEDNCKVIFLTVLHSL